MSPSSSRHRSLPTVDTDRFRLARLPVFALFALLLGGCAGDSSFFAGKRSVPPEFRQKVGLYVHDRAEQVSYYGSAASDVSDITSFHMEQVLPFNTQTALAEIFELVEVSEPTSEGAAGPRMAFKNPDLIGYFEVKITNVRYDYPEAGRPHYRAEVKSLVEFKTMQDETVWSATFLGEGTGFSNTNIRLTDFGRGTSSALEDAFQKVVDEIADGAIQSPLLKEYFRRFTPPPVSSENQSV